MKLTSQSKTRLLASLAAAAGLLITACGSDDSGPTASSAAPPPSAVESPAPSAPAAPAGESVAVTSASSPLGEILVDSSGRTLYGFTKDDAGTSTCVDACAGAWPPAIVQGQPAVNGLDQALVSTVARPDGTTQLKVGKWPLYTFSGDAGPGDVNGQGSGGSWFVVATDGTLIK